MACAIEGCSKPGKLTRGWCYMHYERWRVHGDPNVVFARHVLTFGDRQRRPRYAEPCTIPGCSRVGLRASGWCPPHYQHWRYHGSPTAKRTAPERECDHCGASFTPRQNRSFQRFCSRACMAAELGPASRDARRRSNIRFACPTCGVAFGSNDRLAKFCSLTCREAAKRRPCSACGALFHPGPNGSHVAMCRPCRSAPARFAAALARDAARARTFARVEARLALAVPRPCRGCGIAFVAQRKSQVFHDAACRERDERRLPDNVEHRRRAKLVQRRFRAMIYARDGGVCYLCHQAIDAARRFPDRMSPTIDHVMPYAAGGSDHPSNLRAAHLGCNMDKGDRLPYWWERGVVPKKPEAPQNAVHLS